MKPGAPSSQAGVCEFSRNVVLLRENQPEIARSFAQRIQEPDNSGYKPGAPWWVTLDDTASLYEVTARSLQLRLAKKSEVRFAFRQVRWRGGFRYEVDLFSLPADAKAKYLLRHPDVAARLAGLPPQAETAQPQPPVGTPPAGGTLLNPTPPSSMPPAGQVASPAEGPFSAPPRQALTEEQRQAVHEERWAWMDRQTDASKTEADRRLKILLSALALVNAGMSHRRAFEHAAAEAGEHRTTLTRWHRRVQNEDRADWYPLLAPIHAGAPRDAECSPEAWEFLKGDYLRLEQPGFGACYARLRRAAQAHGWTLPSARTLRRRIEGLDRAVLVLLREGETALKRLYPAQERTVRDLGALAWINGDGYSHNVLVRFPDEKEPDGFFVARPKTWFWQDVYSRMLLAYRTDLSEHTELIRLSFLDVADRFGLPENVLLDNTRAAANKYMTGGVRHRFRYPLKEGEPLGVFPRLEVPVHFCTPAWGQAKPVERTFGVGGIGEVVDKHPLLAGAYTGSDPTERPEYPQKDRDRAVPLETFLKALEDGVREFNARSARRTEVCRGVLSFEAAFRESFERVPVRKLTADQRRMLMLCGEGVTVQRDGTFKLRAGRGFGIGENRYYGEPLLALAGQKVTVYFDPQRLHAGVYAYGADGRALCECACLTAQGFGTTSAAKEHEHARREATKARKALAKAERRLDAADVAAALPTTPEPLPAEAKVVRVEFQRAVGAEMPVPLTTRQEREVESLTRMCEAAEAARADGPGDAPAEPSYMEILMEQQFAEETERREG